MKIHSEDIIYGGIFVFAIVVVFGGAILIGDNSIKVIDGCQYIQHYNGHGWDLVHKGNCTNSIHYKK